MTDDPSWNFQHPAGKRRLLGVFRSEIDDIVFPPARRAPQYQQRGTFAVPDSSAATSASVASSAYAERCPRWVRDLAKPVED